MNVCQIVPSLETRHGGPSKSVLALAEALAVAGNQVELLTTDPQKESHLNAGNLRVDRYRRDWPKSICPSGDMRRRLRHIAADVVHHHSIWLRTLAYAKAAATRLNAPLVLSPRGMMDPWAWGHHSRRKALARALIHPGALEAVAGWHATSPEEAAAIRSLGFTQPVCVAPNGVTLPTENERSTAREHWRRLVPATATRPTALFYSRFHQKKRLLELVDLWLESGPRDWLLLLVGITEDYTPKMLENYVLRAGGSDRVRVFEGQGHPSPYAAANLFLLPSHSENFGLSIAEALAHALPAVVTDTTPWSRLNECGAGWCVPWSAYGAALAAATSESAESLSRRGAAGREWVAREYSWANAARTLSAFYDGLRQRPRDER